MTNDPKVLGAALLWLRNHYDIYDVRHKDLVIKLIDEILLSDDKVNCWVTVDDYNNFINKFVRPRTKRIKV
jgi:hypothetical protein